MKAPPGSFGHVLRGLIKRRKMSLPAFAAVLGMSECAVQSWCRGQRAPHEAVYRLLPVALRRSRRLSAKDEERLHQSWRAFRNSCKVGRPRRSKRRGEK